MDKHFNFDYAYFNVLTANMTSLSDPLCRKLWVGNYAKQKTKTKNKKNNVRQFIVQTTKDSHEELHRL